MDKHAFINRLKILRSIDRHELADAGIDLSDDRRWVEFREHAADWLVRASDEDADRLWALIQKRAA